MPAKSQTVKETKEQQQKQKTRHKVTKPWIR